MNETACASPDSNADNIYPPNRKRDDGRNVVEATDEEYALIEDLGGSINKNPMRTSSPEPDTSTAPPPPPPTTPPATAGHHVLSVGAVEALAEIDWTDIQDGLVAVVRALVRRGFSQETAIYAVKQHVGASTMPLSTPQFAEALKILTNTMEPALHRVVGPKVFLVFINAYPISRDDHLTRDSIEHQMNGCGVNCFRNTGEADSRKKIDCIESRYEIASLVELSNSHPDQVARVRDAVAPWVQGISQDHDVRPDVRLLSQQNSSIGKLIDDPGTKPAAVHAMDMMSRSLEQTGCSTLPNVRELRARIGDLQPRVAQEPGIFDDLRDCNQDTPLLIEIDNQSYAFTDLFIALARACLLGDVIAFDDAVHLAGGDNTMMTWVILTLSKATSLPGVILDSWKWVPDEGDDVPFHVLRLLSWDGPHAGSNVEHGPHNLLAALGDCAPVGAHAQAALADTNSPTQGPEVLTPYRAVGQSIKNPGPLGTMGIVFDEGEGVVPAPLDKGAFLRLDGVQFTVQTIVENVGVLMQTCSTEAHTVTHDKGSIAMHRSPREPVPTVIGELGIGYHQQGGVLSIREHLSRCRAFIRASIGDAAGDVADESDAFVRSFLDVFWPMFGPWGKQCHRTHQVSVRLVERNKRIGAGMMSCSLD